MSMDNYVPRLWAGRYAMMLVELEVCSTCGRLMLPRMSSDPFPRGKGVRKEDQLHNAGWVEQGKTWVNERYSCTECERNDRVLFLCALCGVHRKSSEIKESFGFPPEYLCMTCYNTVVAKEWDEKKNELHESHRWDYE